MILNKNHQSTLSNFKLDQSDQSHIELQAIVSGFSEPLFESGVLFTALELDLFRNISSSGNNVGELAKILDIPQSNLELLLNALTSLGILEKECGCFQISDRFKKHLQKGSSYLGDHLLLYKERHLRWLSIYDYMKGTPDQTSIKLRDNDSSVATSYLKSIKDFNKAYAEEMIHVLRQDLNGCSDILDIGGGHGYYSEQILNQHKEIQATILDFKAPIEYCKQLQNKNPNFNRFRFAVGDVLLMNYSNTFDLVMINDVLHYFKATEKKTALQRAFRSLRIGGTIAISKFTLDEPSPKNKMANLFSLKINLSSIHRGYLETDEELVDLLKSLGGAEIQVRPLGELKSLITAIKV
ncbi:MAG TPA: class I SAM-dependent methyltransferase [Oligoflexia bacterium]|nr:class I SAM-dependent methyltransferase [Oligoflexia bacterium]HMR25456.1 class I SAM-dependent methyltransferase [Oligoflexia bacterium]